MQSKPSALDNLFHELARKRLSDWVDLAEARLRGTGVKCYITGGNDDYPDTLAPLQREDLVRVVGCEGKEVQVRRNQLYRFILRGYRWNAWGSCKRWSRMDHCSGHSIYRHGRIGICATRRHWHVVRPRFG